MIHSLAGGILNNKAYNDFVKVKILDSDKILWYITEYDLKVGNKVFVPLGKNNKLVLGEVLRVDKNISSDCSPISPKMAKYVDRIYKE